MSDEEFEKYIQLIHNKYKIKEKTGAEPYDEMQLAINNVRYMTETEKKLKNHIKSEISKMIKDKTYLGFLIFPGMAGGSSALWGFIESNQKLISASPVMFSLGLAAMLIMYGHKTVKDWSNYINSNPEAIEKLKNAGVYDLLLQQLQTEKEYKEVKKRRG